MNTMKRFSILTIAATLALGLAGTALAQAPQQHFDVRVWNAVTHDYPVTGSMDLNYHSDGVVTGYFHPADLPSYVPIQGGRSGDDIWLTIGLRGTWHLTGHFLPNGRISGSAYDQNPSYDQNIQKYGVPLDLAHGTTFYDFTATPKSQSYGP
jgi:hypothetical protein